MRWPVGTAALSFFDANCYIGETAKPNPLAFHLVRDLIADMDYYGIDQAIVTHAAARDFAAKTGNDLILRHIARCERLLPCWVIPARPDPLGPSGAHLVDEMLDAGVRVARMFAPAPAPYTFDAWARSDVFAALEAHRVPLLLTRSEMARLSDDPPQGFSPENVHDLCTAYPGLPVIIVRFNLAYTRLVFPMLQRCTNLFLEISYYTTHRGLELITRSFGAERLIFGTGMPLSNPGVPLMQVRFANISDAERRLIAGNNLRHLLEAVR